MVSLLNVAEQLKTYLLGVGRTRIHNQKNRDTITVVTEVNRDITKMITLRRKKGNIIVIEANIRVPGTINSTRYKVEHRQDFTTRVTVFHEEFQEQSVDDMFVYNKCIYGDGIANTVIQTGNI